MYPAKLGGLDIRGFLSILSVSYTFLHFHNWKGFIWGNGELGTPHKYANGDHQR